MASLNVVELGGFQNSIVHMGLVKPMYRKSQPPFLFTPNLLIKASSSAILNSCSRAMALRQQCFEKTYLRSSRKSFCCFLLLCKLRSESDLYVYLF